MIDKLISLGECVAKIEAGMTLMVGGFMAVGSPDKIIDAMVSKGTKDLTLICNDTAMVDQGVGKMVVAKQFSKIITSHIGLNKETGRQLNAGETQVELIPQGSLVERIRSAGYGLGGFLTPTGVGTLVEEGKKKFTIDGKDFLLELPLKGNVALLHGSMVDKAGNVYLAKTTRNFNPMMAMACDTVIVEAQKLVEVGDIDPHLVMIPSTLVDYIVYEEDHHNNDPNNNPNGDPNDDSNDESNGDPNKDPNKDSNDIKEKEV